MIRHTSSSDVDPIACLRSQIERLCNGLRETAATFQNGDLSFGDLRVQYDSWYQPQAIGFAEEAKRLAPQEAQDVAFDVIRCFGEPALTQLNAGSRLLKLSDVLYNLIGCLQKS